MTCYKVKYSGGNLGMVMKLLVSRKTEFLDWVSDYQPHKVWYPTNANLKLYGYSNLSVQSQM